LDVSKNEGYFRVQTAVVLLLLGILPFLSSSTL